LMSDCGICGESLSKEYIHKTKCGHTFHYKCLMESFNNGGLNKNECPYCRSKGNKLPLVNGLKKVYPSIHEIDNDNLYVNHKCNFILKKGKNKGNECGKFCLLGYNTCRAHLKNNIKN